MPITQKMHVIAGPCVIEDWGLIHEVGSELKRSLADLEIELTFKASFDKANRSSYKSFRGPGLKSGLELLGALKSKLGLPVLTDVHECSQLEAVSEVVDWIQIPALLSRQTDLICQSAALVLQKGLKLNVKKGQFMAPWDIEHLIHKIQSEQKGPASFDWFTITERGSSFGYNRLVVDMISFQCIQKMGARVIYDATHSLQKPSSENGVTGGQREYLEVLARAAIAAGADGIFLECHPDPSKALSDGATAMPLSQVGMFIRDLLALRSQLPPQRAFTTKMEKSL